MWPRTTIYSTQLLYMFVFAWLMCDTPVPIIITNEQVTVFRSTDPTQPTSIKYRLITEAIQKPTNHIGY
jgi:hypothetical protein